MPEPPGWLVRMTALVKLELVVRGTVLFSGLCWLACDAKVELILSPFGAVRWMLLKGKPRRWPVALLVAKERAVKRGSSCGWP